MTHQERLQEQYEDALFALLMDEVALSEGRKALLENEALKQDPAAAVPEETLRRCRRAIAREFRRRNLVSARRLGRRLLHIAAIIIVLCTVVLSTAVAVSPAARRAALNLAIQALGTDITMGFREGEPPASPSEEPAELKGNWIPPGFRSIDGGTTSFETWRMYSGPDESYIKVKRFDWEGGSLSIDSETPDVEEITVQGHPGFFVEKEGELHLVFVDEPAAISIDLLAEGVSREDLFLFAEHLIYKN